MNVNIDKMLQEQAKLNEAFSRAECLFEEVQVNNADYYKEVVSKTNVLGVVCERMVLTRYISNKVVQVSFADEVLFKDVADYFTMSDAVFYRLRDRKHSEL